MSSVLPKWRVISVAVMIQKGKVLLGLRASENKGRGDLWEFPGGSVELGEQPQSTVIRELREELGIQVQDSEIAGVLCDHRKDTSMFIVFFYIKSWSGDIQKLWHQKLEWFSPEECVQNKIPNINPQLFEKIMSIIHKGVELSLK